MYKFSTHKMFEKYELFIDGQKLSAFVANILFVKKRVRHRFYFWSSVSQKIQTDPL